MGNKKQRPHSIEDIKNENQFLKMKMMLENGATMWSAPGLDPQMENAFLKHVIAVEKEFEKNKGRKKGQEEF